MNLGIIHLYPDINLAKDLGEENKIYIFIQKENEKFYKDLFKDCLNVSIFSIDMKALDNSINYILQISKNFNIELFLPFCEGTLLISGIVSNKLNIPFYSVSNILISRNKLFLSEFLQTFSIPVPLTIPVSYNTKYEDLSNILGHKFILKIVDSMNSQGVILVTNINDYVRELQNLLDYIEKDKPFNLDRNKFNYGNSSVKIIAQELCDGREFNTDVIIINNKPYILGIFEKNLSKGPYFPESMSLYPPKLETIQNKEIYELIDNIVKAFNLVNGVMHIEFRFKDNEIKVLDIGLRYGGAYSIKAINDIYNINYRKEIFKTVSNQNKTLNLIESNVSILYGGIIYDKSGVIESIDGLDVLKDYSKNIKDFKILNKVGDIVVAPPLSSQPHLCYYYIVGKTNNEVISLHNKIQNNLSIKIKEVKYEEKNNRTK